MKYRLLTIPELQSVEKEFVQFLASHSIVAAEWEALKANEPEKVTGLVSIFSEIFWEKALSNLSCLIQRHPRLLRAYRADGPRIELIEIRLSEATSHRFSDDESWHLFRSGQLTLNELKAEVFKGNKNAGTERNRELFTLLERGAEPCSCEFFDQLTNAITPEH